MIVVKTSHTFSVACRCHKTTFPFSPCGEILKDKAEQGEVSMLAVIHQTAASGAGTLRELGVPS